jgi:hypothetical protein
VLLDARNLYETRIGHFDVVGGWGPHAGQVLAYRADLEEGGACRVEVHRGC